MDNPTVFMVEKDLIMNSYKQLCEEILEYNEHNTLNEKHMFQLEDINITNEINIGDFGIPNSKHLL